MSVEVKRHHHVLEKELDRILERRDVAYQETGKTSNSTSRNKRLEGNDTTGLALSGGGVRSAAFSLGFLQGLYRAGRMKGFDFLSTVSGGGYAGAFFSTDVIEQDKVNWDRDGDRDRLSFEPNRDKTPSESVTRLGMHGRVMGNFLELFSRHLWGFIVNVVFTVSGIVAIAALLAYFMRMPWNPSTLEGGWTPHAMDIVAELGFQTDVTKPFFFAFIALSIWFTSHAINKIVKVLGKKPVAFTRYTYLLLIASVILGFLTLIAIEDVAVTSWIDDFDLDPALSGRLNSVAHWVATGLSAVFAAMLLPYLSPTRLLKSGQASAGSVNSLIFRTAGNAVLVGVPLFLFFFLAHENISGEASNRINSDQVLPAHLTLIKQWTQKLQSQTISDSPTKEQLGSRVLSALNGKTKWDEPPVKMPPIQGNLESYLDFDKDVKKAKENLNFAARWYQFFDAYFRPTSGYYKRIDLKKNTRATSANLAVDLNRLCISDPNLFITLGIPEEGENAEENLHEAILNELGIFAESFVKKDAEKSRLREKCLMAMGDLQVAQKSFKNRFADATSIDEKLDNESSSFIGLMYLALELKKTNDVAAIPETRGIKEKFRNVHRSLVALLYPLSDSQKTNDVDPIFKEGTFSVERVALTGPALTEIGEFFQDERKAFTKIKKAYEKISPTKITNKDSESTSSLPSEKLERESFNKWFDRVASAYNEDLAQVRANNWMLLSEAYPIHIRQQDTVFASVVNVADQSMRLQIAFWALSTFLAVGTISNLNSTSLHGVYRDQLARIWTPDDSMKLSKLNTCDKGAPYQLINATVNRMGNRNDPDPEGKSRFLLSEMYCGTRKLGYRETDDYQQDNIAVADAVAISGAAVTSMSSRNFLQRMILFLTNCRLGQWLRNPINHRVDRYWPSPIRALGSLVWYPDQRSHLFVSDGGHLDNTGISALLERRCGLIVCLDGGFDPKSEFAELLKVLHAARGKYGITVRPLTTETEGKVTQVCDSLEQLRTGNISGNASLSKSHFVSFEVEYPEKDENGKPLKAVLIYCKSSLTGDEPIELTELARTHKTFPNDPTSDQFLTADVFEAYTALGRHIADQLDGYFGSGALKQFDLPLCWNGPAADGSKKHHQNVKPNPDVDHRQFSSLPFNEGAVDSAIKGLEEWCKIELVHGMNNPKEDFLVALSEWARELGSEAKQPLRKQFCESLSNIIDLHGEEISDHVGIRVEFFNMLSMLGDRVPKSRLAMKKLSSGLSG